MSLRAHAALVAALLPLAGGALPAKHNAGTRPRATFAQLMRGFRQPSMLYAPYAFWFWDAPPDPARAAAVATEMCRQGFMPGYLHPRTGLPRHQWLSREWFDAVDAALSATERAGGFMGFTDEYDWPAGQAAGRVLAARPELRAQSLSWQTLDVAADSRATIPACLFATAAELDASGLIRSSTLRVIGGGPAFSWTPPKGTWRVFAFSTYHHAGLDGSPVNYLDPRVAETFIRIAHEPYARRFGNRLGKAMSGVFIDNEGDYGWKLAWSDHLDRTYRARWGRDIRLWMPLLVTRDVEGVYARARWEWLDTVSDIYANGFFGKISRWCADHGMSCMMHVWEESLQLQAEAVGDYFKVMRAVSMPGTDSLVRKPLECQEFKETQSISEFEGRRFCSEVLGVVGWDMPPALLKQTTNAVTAWGVSHVMPHGVYMRPDLNTIPYPPDFFTINPYWPYIRQWTDFTRRASYVASHGHTVPDVLLLNPMDSLWATIGEWLFDPKPDEVARVARINETYMGAIRTLTEARIEFLIADRYYIGKMAVRNRRLTIGPFSFGAVVVPPVTVLPLNVMRKLVVFARAGGRVYVLGSLPEGSTDRGMGDPEMSRLVRLLREQRGVVECRDGLSAELARPGSALTSHIRFVSGAFPMLQSHRRIDGRDFFWLANQAETPRECVLLIRGAHGAVSLWDCDTGAIRPVPSAETQEGTRVRLVFRPLEAFFLVLDPQERPLARAVSHAERLSAVTLTGPWRVSIVPHGQPRVAPDVQPLYALSRRAAALDASGGGRFVREFVLPSKPRSAIVAVTAEPGFRLYVNGTCVPKRAVDDVWRQVRRMDLAPMLRVGTNRIAASIPATASDGWFLLQGDAVCVNGTRVRLDTGAGWLRSRAVTAEADPVGPWIWAATVKPNQTIWLRRSFDIPADARIRTAVAYMSADNRFTLWVNGRRIGAHEPWMELASFDLRAALHAGRNTLAVQASNDDGPAGMTAGVVVGLADGREVRVVSDTDWRVSEQPDPSWLKPTFNDSHWPNAIRVADYGQGPWGRFDGPATGAAPAWTWGELRSDAWAPATARPTLPEDVPSSMLREHVRPLANWLSWGLDRFSSYVDYQTTFDMDTTGHVRLDLGNVRHMAEVFVNGKRAGSRLWAPFEFDISAYVRRGRNELRVRVGNLATNVMAQFADRGILSTWGWGPAPVRESYDAGLFGPVVIRRPTDRTRR